MAVEGLFAPRRGVPDLNMGVATEAVNYEAEFFPPSSFVAEGLRWRETRVEGHPGMDCASDPRCPAARQAECGQPYRHTVVPPLESVVAALLPSARLAGADQKTWRRPVRRAPLVAIGFRDGFPDTDLAMPDEAKLAVEPSGHLVVAWAVRKEAGGSGPLLSNLRCYRGIGSWESLRSCSHGPGKGSSSKGCDAEAGHARTHRGVIYGMLAPRYRMQPSGRPPARGHGSQRAPSPGQTLAPGYPAIPASPRQRCVVAVLPGSGGGEHGQALGNLAGPYRELPSSSIGIDRSRYPMTIWQVAIREARRTCAKCPPVPTPLPLLSLPTSSASGRSADSLRSSWGGRRASTRRPSLGSRAASANRRSKRSSSSRVGWRFLPPSCLPGSTERQAQPASLDALLPAGVASRAISGAGVRKHPAPGARLSQTRPNARGRVPMLAASEKRPPAALARQPRA